MALQTKALPHAPHNAACSKHGRNGCAFGRLHKVGTVVGHFEKSGYVGPVCALRCVQWLLLDGTHHLSLSPSCGDAFHSSLQIVKNFHSQIDIRTDPSPRYKRMIRESTENEHFLLTFETVVSVTTSDKIKLLLLLPLFLWVVSLSPLPHFVGGPPVEKEGRQHNRLKEKGRLALRLSFFSDKKQKNMWTPPPNEEGFAHIALVLWSKSVRTSFLLWSVAAGSRVVLLSPPLPCGWCCFPTSSFWVVLLSSLLLSGGLFLLALLCVVVSLALLGGAAFGPLSFWVGPVFAPILLLCERVNNVQARLHCNICAFCCRYSGVSRCCC